MSKGTASAISAYAIWGLFPIYWKFLHTVPALQLMTHRVVWALIFVVAVMTSRGEWAAMRKEINRRTLLVYLLAGVLLAINWLVYIWAVNAGFIVESSLGYFINPLVNVLLGVVFLRERMRPLQWIPIALASAGVLYLTVSYGKLPWIALVLAFSFGFYGLIKKMAPLGSLHGLTLETALLFVPSLGVLLFAEFNGTGAFGHTGWVQAALMMGTGLVTAIPLLLFSEGVRNTPLTLMGLLQFLAPTMQFRVGVLVYREPFSGNQVVGFVIIWAALILFTVENLWQRRQSALAAQALPK
ncbi:MAG: EamA family transporter RarD [Anaerolineae bacterium]|nr:EamA family transporter RarD [Anaerolineae bacterium]